MPFYHCFGMVMGNLACTSHGYCVVVGRALRSAGGPETVTARRCRRVARSDVARLDHPRFHAELGPTTLRTGSWPGSRPVRSR